MTKELSMATVTIFLFLSLLQNPNLADAQIGVCYGKSAADNLPPVDDVVDLYNQYDIKQMRIYDNDEEVLNSVQDNSFIKLMIGVTNQDIIPIGCDPVVAKQWVDKYVVPYASSIKYIAVGNEVPLDNPQAQYIVSAMENIQNALNSYKLGRRIKVSTAISQDLLNNTYPPSSAEFTNVTFMGPIVNFLVANESPLFLNVLTYIDYNASKDDISFILFTLRKPKYTDPKTGLKYFNQYDAVMDAAYTALGKVEGLINATMQTNASPANQHAKVAQTENAAKVVFGKKKTPSYYTNGVDGATARDYAQTYFRNLIAHAKKGTPLRPKEPVEIFLFEMFDEDQKPGDPMERHLGLFTPDQCPKYDLCFSG